MSRYYWLGILLLFMAAPAVARQSSRTLDAGAIRTAAAVPGDHGPKSAVAADPDRSPIRHATLELLEREDSRQALAEFHRLKALGLLPVARKRSVSAGSLQSFNVWNFETNTYEARDFTFKVSSDRFDIWVETERLTDGSVDDAQIELLREALADKTPPGSIDPNRGIIANDEIVFGDPPDADGDGKTDVLFVDVRDGWVPGEGFTAGYVDPRDVGPPNSRDIIYIDIEPTVRLLGLSEAIQTTAHEYQHLIMLNYDRFENAFVNEGLSMWAELVNGFHPYAATQLQEPDELRVSLLDWRGGGPNVNDYRRAGLFTTYLYEQIGVVATGSITKSPSRGAIGYQSVLSPLSIQLPDLVASFHVANALGRVDVDPRYGYFSERFLSVSVASEFEFDGAASSETTTTTPAALRPGAASYSSWESVSNFRLSIDVAASQSLPTTARSRIRPHAILWYEDGRVEVAPVDLGNDEAYFPGNFQRVMLAVPHVRVDLDDVAPNRVTFSYSARWNEVQPAFQEKLFAFEDGTIYVSDPEGPTIEAYTFGPGGSSNFELDSRAANRFEIAEGSLLRSLSIAPLFEADFAGASSTGPRDYTVTLWGENDEGDPGDEILSFVRTDGRAGSLTSSGDSFAYVFDEIDMAPFRDDLGALPTSLFVGIANAGSDTNYLVVPVSAYAGADNPSWFYLVLSAGPDWAAFSGLRTGENVYPLLERVVPIRATFLEPLIPTDRDDLPELPESATLEANYPNPFNPSTTFAFALDRPQSVRLAVYDVTGRQVAVVSDGWRAAGRHEVAFDGSGLASGLYLYRMQTESGALSRRMMLIK